MADFAELHCHSNFSFLDGASPVDDLAERAVELGLSALAVTDHQGLYGAVRFATAAQEAGLRPIVGMEIELLDAVAPDPGGLIVPLRRRKRRGRTEGGDVDVGGSLLPAEGRATKPAIDDCGRPAIACRGARICAACGRASSGRISSCWRVT